MHKIVILLISVLAVGCSKPVEPPEPIRPVKVTVTHAQASTANLTLAGEVLARYESPLAFRVGGKVTERRVNLGDTVRKRQVLARLEPTDLQLAAQSDAAAVSGAQTELALAEAELTRYRSLRDKGFISAAVLDQKQATADSARARLTAAESSHSEKGRQVGYTTLLADSDGVITWLDLNAGQVVAAGQPLLKIARAGELEIEVHVPETLLSRFKAAREFRVVLSAQPDKTFYGKLRELAAAAAPATRTYAARISVANAAEAMNLGMSTTVYDVPDTSPAIRLPLSSLISRDGKPTVWKLDAAGSMVHSTLIETGAIDGNDILVESGLSEGDIVVTAGANLLREGQKVRALP
jgi:membrane fusion protein, multidrug efflux system